MSGWYANLDRHYEHDYLDVRATYVDCVAGRYGEKMQLSNVTCSGLCEKGFYCPAGSTSRTQNPCGDSSLYCPEGSPKPVAVSRGYYSILGQGPNTRADQRICDVGHYCVVSTGLKIACPAGTYGSSPGLAHDVGPIFGEMNVFSCSGG